MACEFHMKQAIFWYIFKGNTGSAVKNKMNEDKDIKIELRNGLSNMIDAATPEEFEKEKSKIIEN